MADQDPYYGNPTWHLFIAAAITGLTQAAYKKNDFDCNIDEHERDMEFVRVTVAEEALEIADLMMSRVVDRLDEDKGGGWKSAHFEIARMHGAMTKEELQEFLRGDRIYGDYE